MATLIHAPLTMSTPTPSSLAIPRRHFLKLAGAGAVALAAPAILRAQATDDRVLKIGIVGCGGRGTGAIFNALNADPNVVLWAMADVFPEKLEGSFQRAIKRYDGRVQVDETRKFVGLDSYQKIADSDVDVVLLTSPPGFRPKHMKAMVDAGKHLFMEKPVAVDVAGVKSVLESAKRAKAKGLSVQHGLCWRFDRQVKEGYGKVLAGDFGRVVSVYGTYLATPPKVSQAASERPAGMGDVEWQIRNWMAYDWTSGGCLVEQGIHTVDKVSWAMNNALPVAAVATGGRSVLTGPGNTFDNYNVNYEFANKQFCQAVSRQWRGAFSETADRVFCTDATLHAPNRVMAIDANGKRVWRSKIKRTNMYDETHIDLFGALRSGKQLDHGEYLANMTMMAIMGREAARSGQRITWEQMWNSDQSLVPENIELGSSFTPQPLAVPGKYEVG